MKMNKPYIEIVRFDAEDVIATSGVCAVTPLSTNDIVLHYDYHNNNYFVYDYGNNTKTLVDDHKDYTLHHNGETTQYSSVTGKPGSKTTGYTGYSAYLYNGKDGWYWWDDDTGSHGNY